MVKTKISKDVILTVLGLFVGFVSGLWISEHFYQKNRKDVRESLIEVAKTDIGEWLREEIHPQLYDSVKFAKSGTPWPKLSVRGLEDLSRNIYGFEDFENFEEFKDLVSGCRREAEWFNERMSLRNISIVTKTGVAALLSPKAYHDFHAYVLPSADSLLTFLKENRSGLLGNN